MSDRIPLDLPTVVQAGLAVMDDEGLHGVTVRRIAHRLGVQPGALYRHIESKQHLLDEMDAAMTADDLTVLSRPGDDQTWSEWLAARARAFRTAFLRHRDGALLHATAHPVPGSEQVIARERELIIADGFTSDEAAQVLFAVIQFTVGATIEQQNARASRAPFFQATFELGLRAMLDGFQQRRR